MADFSRFSKDELYNAYKRYTQVLGLLNGNLEFAQKMLTSFSNHLAFAMNESLREEIPEDFLSETDEINDFMIDLGEEFRENDIEVIGKKIRSVEEKILRIKTLLQEIGDSRVVHD